MFYTLVTLGAVVFIALFKMPHLWLFAARLVLFLFPSNMPQPFCFFRFLLIFWNYKLFQVYSLLSLSQSCNQLVLQRTILPFIQFSSVAQSCLTLCNPMDCSTPGLPVHHQLTEFTQTHVHQVSDAIQPSHPLSSPSLLLLSFLLLDNDI